MKENLSALVEGKQQPALLSETATYNEATTPKFLKGRRNKVETEASLQTGNTAARFVYSPSLHTQVHIMR